MSVLRFLILVAAVLISTGRAAAQPSGSPLGDYTVTTWNENGGLPGGRIRSLAQDADGYLWIGTDAGLVRFDGVRFAAWGAASGETRLPVGAVTTVLSARDRSLWVGLTGRMALGRIKGGTVALYGEQEGFGPNVLALIEDREGAIWAGTSGGLFRFRRDRWEKVWPAANMPRASVPALLEDARQRLWFATPTAVYRRDRADAPFEQVDAIAVSSNVRQSFAEDAFGQVWISDFTEGFRAPATTGRRRPSGPRGWGIHLLADSRKSLWVGTQGRGLWRVRADGGRGLGAPEVITEAHGLASNAVQALLEDREGNVWVGTFAGLQRLTPRRVQPIRQLAVGRAIARAPGGDIWVGAASGLVRLSSSGRRDFTETDGLPGAVVLALHVDGRGDLWVSTERGLSRFSAGRFSPLLVTAGGNMQRILGITGSGDTVWLRDFYQQVLRWRDGRVTMEDIPESLQRAVSSLHADAQGRLWMGSRAGRLAVRQPSGVFVTYELGIGNVVCLTSGRNGVTWAGGDDGLTAISDARTVTVTRRNGLAGAVKSVVEDEAGLVWVGTEAGILRIEPAELDAVAADPAHQIRYRLFNTSDGVAGAPIGDGSPVSLRGSDGRIWVLTSSGVTVFHPHDVGPPLQPPVARIASVTVDAKSYAPSASPDFPPRSSHLQIGYTALLLSDPMRVRYRYRLDGYDREWVDARTAQQATYTNLPPGTYRFRVEASAGDGAWDGSAATLDFRIPPTFYQTRWFAVLCTAFVCLAVYAAWRLHVRQVRQQFALVLAERIRMSRAIHDTLLQGLAGLALQVDDLSHVSGLEPSGRQRILGIRRQAEEYIRQARRSILDLRTPSLASRDLPRALKEVAERAIGDKPVALDVTVTGTPAALTPATDEQLLLIGQEAVTNALRHAGPTKVAVAIDYLEDHTRLRVVDNGCGFDPTVAEGASGHYGLVSMRERAQQVHGRLTIASSPGHGTEVETVVPA